MPNMAPGVRDYMASVGGYASGDTPTRQSMIGTGDIQSFSTTEAMIQAELEMYEQLLAETDLTTQPIKAFLVKQKISELTYQLAQTAQGLGGAIAGWAESANADLAQQSEALERQEQNLGWGMQQGGYYPEMGFGQAAPQPSYSNPNVPYYMEFGKNPSAWGAQGQTQQSPVQGYQPPAYMQPWLSNGQARPLGMQTQAGPLQQAALWEQNMVGKMGVKSLEDYLKNESYIDVMGEEMKAKSKALAPKQYNYRSLWERALQR